MSIVFEVPMEVPSAANLREHHMVRARRVKSQRNATTLRMPRWDGGPLLVVTLTRVAPRALDDDNLPMSLKAVRDAVAAKLRVDDATPLVAWRYAQERCGAKETPRVRVELARAQTVGQAFHEAMLRPPSDGGVL